MSSTDWQEQGEVPYTPSALNFYPNHLVDCPFVLQRTGFTGSFNIFAQLSTICAAANIGTANDSQC